MFSDALCYENRKLQRKIVFRREISNNDLASSALIRNSKFTVGCKVIEGKCQKPSMNLQNCQRDISYKAQARDRFSKESDAVTFIGHVACVMLFVCYLLRIIQKYLQKLVNINFFNCMCTEHMHK